ncbi:MAG TPA: hypothetical protein VK454_08420 [Myxococcaceae bacterium]|nr:hypothetical protein [Myxococcaceae bacterium]
MNPQGDARIRGLLPALLLCCLAVPLSAGAQEQLLFPPTLIVPNSNRVFPGLSESIQAGAAVVRVSTPPAIWYNPSGMVLSEHTTVNASVQGYQLTLFTGSNLLKGGTQESNISTVPTFVGILLGTEVIPLKNLRIGFGMSNPISWSQGVNNASRGPNSAASILFGANSEFTQYQAAGAVSYAVSDRFRIGFSLVVPYTYISNNGQLNGQVSKNDLFYSAISTVFMSGYNFHLLTTASFQWQPLDWLSFGGVIQPPALRVIQGGNITVQALSTLNSSTDARTVDLSFRDTKATFSYVIPPEVSGGAAVHFGPVELELDAHWYLATGPYYLFSSTEPVNGHRAVQGSPPVTSLGSFPGQVWGTKNIVDLNFGTSVKVSELITLLAGFYTSLAPGNVPSYVFQPVTLYGVRAGLSFSGSHLSFSVGLGYEWGSTTIPLADVTAPGAEPVTFNQPLDFQTLSILFALAYVF